MEAQITQPPILPLFSSSEVFQTECEKHLTQKILEIRKQHNINDESITIFYKILNNTYSQKGKILIDNITGNQYRDLFILFDIFKIKFMPYFNDVDLAIDLIKARKSLPNDTLSVDLEECLTNNIEKCFENEKFGQLEVSTIYRIIAKYYDKKPSNQSNITDMLLNFIVQSIEKMHILFSFIKLEDLSDEKTNELFNFYQNLNDSKKDIYFKILSKDFAYICKLRQEIDRLKNKIKKISYSSILYDHSIENQFKGILYHLKKINEKDYMDKKIVKVTSSSVRNDEPKESPYYTIDFNEKTRFVSANEENSFICFDFEDISVRLKSYSIKSSIGSSEKQENPKNWVIEGSNDNKNWQTLDKPPENKSIDGKGKSKSFDIKNPNGFFRYLRFRQIGENTTEGSYTLKIGQIEFFGEIQ